MNIFFDKKQDFFISVPFFHKSYPFSDEEVSNRRFWLFCEKFGKNFRSSEKIKESEKFISLSKKP